MKKFIFPLLVFLSVNVFSQTTYWQQVVNYRIDVALDDLTHSLSGKIDMDYINNSPDTLTYIWFHLWPNAYKNDKTALAKQVLADKDSRRKWKNIERGYIDSLKFMIDGLPASTIPDPENVDVVKVMLSQPLMPGNKINITTPFYVKLPSYFSRSGHDGQQYMICQWYPKPAVYDRNGWHQMPYLDQGEFYSEFGTFAVSITVPSAYIVGATGTLNTASELQKYKSIGAANYKALGKISDYIPDVVAKNKTLNYYGENIHDFAWFADKEFVIQYDTLQLKSGKIIDVFSYYRPNGNSEWSNSIGFIEDAVVNYSNWIGEYPYPAVAAVEGPKNVSSGGMEYPMITLITSPDAKKELLDAVIAHEVGHNWFYGILATNERDHPWMDEGINSFYQFRYEATKYRSNSIFGNSIPEVLKNQTVDNFLTRVYSGLNSIPAKPAVANTSTAFANKEEYGIVVYLKTAIWMSILEASVGKENLDRGMKEFFNEWKFRHPYPEDFKASLERTLNLNLDEIFLLLKKQGNFN